MIALEWVAPLRLLHGTYNTMIALAFVYQGWLGLRVRKTRRSGDGGDFRTIRLHRGNGPILVLLGALGYAAGVALIVLDKGHIFEYRLHHLVGMTIVILMAAALLVSRKIKGPISTWRTLHFLLGLAILVAYLLQLLLGLNILL
jgi:hypothetical protein